MKRFKTCLLICFVALITVMVAGCGCEHEYGEWGVATAATCIVEGTEERSCTKCGEKETRPLVKTEHMWDETDIIQDATCTEPGNQKKICSVCKEEVMETVEAIGHDWTDANCENPRICANCNLTEGEALGHTWKGATCDTPKTCTTCGATDGSAKGHTYKVTPTCSVCGAKNPNTSKVVDALKKCERYVKYMEIDAQLLESRLKIYKNSPTASNLIKVQESIDDIAESYSKIRQYCEPLSELTILYKECNKVKTPNVSTSSYSTISSYATNTRTIILYYKLTCEDWGVSVD